LRHSLRALGSSGWLPATILAVAAVVVLVAYDTPIADVAIFALYVVLAVALPGTLLVRLLRGHSSHLAEDLTLGLTAGYCIEIATYVAARAVNAPLLFLVWPVLTLGAFAVVPRLRRHWRGGGVRAPAWWSWSLAAMLGYLLIYSAGTVFAQEHLTGTDTPYVDMPFHLALIGELRHHVPPVIPYVTGVPLAYHWFYYAEAAATTWATGIEPLTLLYRLSALPMFAAFVVLVAAGARRLTGGWWSGPVAVAVALFGVVAGPYGWITDSVWDTQTLLATWTSPTNILGLALFSATIVVFLDLLRADVETPRLHWVLAGILVFGLAGAKASQLPLLIAGLAAVIAGVALGPRRIHRPAVIGLGIATIGFVGAIILLFRGSSGGLIIGLDGLQSFPISISVGTHHASGIAPVAGAVATLLVALVLWSFLWAGAYGLLVRKHRAWVDPSILLLLGVCAAALGAVSIFLYPGLGQLYYLRGAAGAFGLLVVAGIATLLPIEPRRRLLFAAATVAALIGAVAVVAVQALGPQQAPSFADDRISTVLLDMLLPAVALAAVAGVGTFAARLATRRVAGLNGAAPLLVVVLVMSFGAPRAAAVVASPFSAPSASGLPIPGVGRSAARWLRDHSDPADLVATNLHCLDTPETPDVCDARHFWVSAFTERRILVEGWAYTAPAVQYANAHGVSDRTGPFWDPALLAENDAAFTHPSESELATLRATRGVRWLFADLTAADGDALGRLADLRHREGDFAVYELR
jgi:hypothetical protein